MITFVVVIRLGSDEEEDSAGLRGKLLAMRKLRKSKLPLHRFEKMVSVEVQMIRESTLAAPPQTIT